MSKSKKLWRFIKLNIQDFWDNTDFFQKLHTLMVLGVIIFCPLAFFFGSEKNWFFSLINDIGTFFTFVAFLYFLRFVDYMFETPHRRRLFYLMIILTLGACSYLSQYFTEDVDIRYGFAAASLFSVVLAIPAFLSYWKPIYYDKD